MADEEYTIFPFFVVIDTSGSMDGEPLDAVNQALPDLLGVVKDDPMTQEIARLGLIEFNYGATVRLPLSDLATVDTMPTLSAGGGTSYTSAFQTLRQQLETVRTLGKRFYRPVAFFISDGNPTDQGWESALTAVTDSDFKYRPSIVAFGFGDVDPEVLGKVGTRFAFMAKDGDPVEAVKEIFNQLLKSMIATSQSASSNQPGLTLGADITERFEPLPVIEP
jgi:uncharacterized protein YegL